MWQSLYSKCHFQCIQNGTICFCHLIRLEDAGLGEDAQCSPPLTIRTLVLNLAHFDQKKMNDLNAPLRSWHAFCPIRAGIQNQSCKSKISYVHQTVLKENVAPGGEGQIETDWKLALSDNGRLLQCPRTRLISHQHHHHQHHIKAALLCLVARQTHCTE